MKNIFRPKENAKVRQNDIIAKGINTSTFGTQSLWSLGRKIWNNLRLNIKSETSFPKFKEYIKIWLGPKCSMHKHANRKCSVVFLDINLSRFGIYLSLLLFLYIFIDSLFSKDKQSFHSFNHGFYCYFGVHK